MSKKSKTGNPFLDFLADLGPANMSFAEMGRAAEEFEARFRGSWIPEAIKISEIEELCPELRQQLNDGILTYAQYTEELNLIHQKILKAYTNKK